MFKKIKERYIFNKQVLNKLRFRLKYIIAPVYGFSNLALFIACFVLFAKVKSIYFILAMLIFSFASTIAMLIYNRFVGKKEIEMESESLKKFFSSTLLDDPQNKYDLFLDDGEMVQVSFLENNICIDNVIYPKNSFSCSMFTSNFMCQVNLLLIFEHNNTGSKEGKENDGVSFSLPLNLNTLSVLKKYNIELKNPDVLKFIKDNPELAVNQVLKYGKIQDDYKSY